MASTRVFRTSSIDAETEARRIEGDHVVHALGEFLLQLLAACHDTRCNFQRVGAGLQENPHADSRMAIEGNALVIAVGAQFDACDVLDAQGAARAAGTDDDVAELLRGQQPALGGDRVNQLLVVRRRLLADLASCSSGRSGP